jgi:hypothetical protein
MLGVLLSAPAPAALLEAPPGTTPWTVTVWKWGRSRSPNAVSALSEQVGTSTLLLGAVIINTVLLLMYS